VRAVLLAAADVDDRRSFARRDGIVVQDVGKGDMDGYNDSNEQPDRAAAEADVRVAAELFGRWRPLGQSG